MPVNRLTLDNLPIDSDKVDRAMSLITGTLLAYYGARKRNFLGGAMALVGAGLVRRGALGFAAGPDVIHVQRAVTINKAREEVFGFWQKLENLPRFMKRLKSVRVTGPGTSHWVMHGLGNRTIEWDAETVAESEGEFISWRALPGARIKHYGTVRFEDAPAGRGTVVRLAIHYYPPAGALGRAVASFAGLDPGERMAEDLRGLKAVLETGQMANREDRGAEKSKAAKEQQIHEASEHSFPASDAPSYS